MRILFSQLATIWGGSVRSLYWLATGLADEHEIHLAHYGCPTFGDDFRSLGVELHRFRGRTFEQRALFRTVTRVGLRRGAPTLLALPRAASDWIPSALAFARLVHRVQPDLVHTNESIRVNRAEIIGASLARVPVVAHLRGVHNLSRADRAIAKLVTRFIAVSEASRESYVSSGISPDRIDVVHNAIELPQMLPANERRKLRHSLGLDDGFWLVSAGRLIPRKGNREAIAALRILRDRGHNVKLLVLGHGPEASLLAEDAHRLEVAGAVELRGWQDDPLRYLLASDALLMPAQEPEGFPRAILEGMACGLPIVATDAGGAREVFTPGASGILAHRSDPAGLAQAIGELLHHPDTARSFGRAARFEARDKYDVRAHASAVRSVYRSVLTDQRAP